MDISMLRDRPFDGAVTVSELNGYIKNIFESDSHLRSVTVKGEISNFIHHKSGHLYFSLKDEAGQIKAVMFRSSAQSLRFSPQNGMKVVAHGSVTVYPRDGGYQIYVTSLRADGLGELHIAYERLKEKLAEEGLFDIGHKLPIPKYPRRVGVITSPTGAAVRDIINVATRRMPSVSIYLYPALVQGDGAEAQLIKAVDYFDNSGLVDVIIIGRGGGSIEDLWAFNSEALARRIYSATVPIISAVGHQTDFTICDFVSDMRAPTPSGGAELAVADHRDLLRFVDLCHDRCDKALIRRLSLAKDRLLAIESSRVLSNPMAMIEDKGERVSALNDRAHRSLSNLLGIMRGELAALSGRAEALSPLSVLSRGYSVVKQNGRAVTDSASLIKGDSVTIVLSKGSAEATVTSVNEKS